MTSEIVRNVHVRNHTLTPATHESYRLSKIYSCLLAQPIAHRVRVNFTEFYALCNFSLTSNMFDTI